MKTKPGITLRPRRRHQQWFPAEEPFPSEAEAVALLRKLAAEKAGISKEQQPSSAGSTRDQPLQFSP